MPRQILATQMLVAFNFCLQLEGENCHSLLPCTIPLPDSLPPSKLPAPSTPLLSVSQSFFFCQAFSSTSNTWRLFLPCPHHFCFILLHFQQTPLHVPLFFALLHLYPNSLRTLCYCPHLCSPFFLTYPYLQHTFHTNCFFAATLTHFLVLLPSISLLAVPWIKENVIMTV